MWLGLLISHKSEPFFDQQFIYEALSMDANDDVMGEVLLVRRFSLENYEGDSFLPYVAHASITMNHSIHCPLLQVWLALYFLPFRHWTAYRTAPGVSSAFPISAILEHHIWWIRQACVQILRALSGRWKSTAKLWSPFSLWGIVPMKLPPLDCSLESPKVPVTSTAFVYILQLSSPMQHSQGCRLSPPIGNLNTRKKCIICPHAAETKLSSFFLRFELCLPEQIFCLFLRSLYLTHALLYFGTHQCTFRSTVRNFGDGV